MKKRIVLKAREKGETISGESLSSLQDAMAEVRRQTTVEKIEEGWGW